MSRYMVSRLWASGIYLVNHVSDSDIVELLKPGGGGEGGRGFG